MNYIKDIILCLHPIPSSLTQKTQFKLFVNLSSVGSKVFLVSSIATCCLQIVEDGKTLNRKLEIETDKKMIPLVKCEF